MCPTTTPPAQELLRAFQIPAAAELLNVSRKTLVRMIDAGHLKTVRPLGAGRGRLVLVTEQSIRDFLATATDGSAS